LCRSSSTNCATSCPASTCCDIQILCNAIRFSNSPFLLPTDKLPIPVQGTLPYGPKSHYVEKQGTGVCVSDSRIVFTVFKTGASRCRLTSNQHYYKHTMEVYLSNVLINRNSGGDKWTFYLKTCFLSWKFSRH
jgi:hypothetical protein